MNRKKDRGCDVDPEGIFPLEERIDDFDSLWNMIYDEVVSYWEQSPDTEK